MPSSAADCITIGISISAKPAGNKAGTCRHNILDTVWWDGVRTHTRLAGAFVSVPCSSSLALWMPCRATERLWLVRGSERDTRRSRPLRAQTDGPT